MGGLSAYVFSPAACDENNSVHSERFRVYKVPIWPVKTEIVGIAPALEQQHKANAVPGRNMEGCHVN